MSEKKDANPSRFFGSRPLRSWRLWGLLFFFTYTLFGFIGAPYIIKSQLIAKTPELLNRQLSISEVHVNPFTFAITIQDLSLADLDDVELMGLEKLHVNFDTFSLFRWAWTFSDISFTQPRFNLRIDPSGTPSFADLINTDPPSTQENAETPLPRVVIQRFHVSGGQFNFEDQSIATPFKQLIDPINFNLMDFSTLPEKEGPYAIYVKVPGEGVIRWQGDISVNPLRSTGNLKLSSLPLTTAWQYAQDHLKFSLDSGLLSGELGYDFYMSDAGPEFFTDDLQIQVTEVEIQDPSHKKSILALPNISLSGGQFDLRQQTLSIAEFAIKGGDIDTFMDRDGNLHLAQLLTPITEETPPPAQDEAEQETEEKPWTFKLDRASIKAFNIRLIDRATEPHAEIRLTDTTIDLTDITNQAEDQFDLQASLTLNDKGSLKISGKVAALEPMADLALDITNIPLVDFQAYLNQTTNVDLLSGHASLQSQLFYKKSANDADITLTGQLKVKDFSAKNRLSEDQIISWKALALDDINLQLSPDKLDIDSVSLDQLNSRIIIAKNGDINVSSLAKTEEPTASPPPEKEKEADKTSDPFPISIGIVRLKNNTFSFVDNTVTPRFSSRFKKANGTIKGLSSDHFARADVDISGRIDDHAALLITGKINPLSEDLYTDLKLTFSDYSMAALTPYTGRYIGNAIDKGRMSFELNYHIAENKLTGENKILLDQFTLGRKIDSADALSLPVGLAIALLKDTRGMIDLDVPVKGDLDDPKFRLGGLIFKALANIITKIATSPFKMLSKLAGGGEDMDKVLFIPGELNLLPEQNKRLETLGNALKERPQLALEVRGQFNQRDKLILQQQKLIARLNATGDLPSADASLDTLTLRVLEKNYSAQAGEEAMNRLKSKHTKTNEEAAEKEPIVMDPDQYKAAVLDSLMQLETVSDGELRDLARSRADTIRNHFVNKGGLEANRIFVLEAEADTSEEKEGVSTLFTLVAK